MNETISIFTFSPITIPEATCVGYERGARCMLPLLECMEDDEKEKLNKVFEKDFHQLNTLLSNNGFPTCKAFGISSFNAFGPYQLDVEDTQNIEDENQDLGFISSPTLKERIGGKHFLPTKSPNALSKKRKRKLSVGNRQRNYKSFSRILI